MRIPPRPCPLNTDRATLTIGITIQVHALDRKTLRMSGDSSALFAAIAEGPFRNDIRRLDDRATIEIDSRCHATIDQLRLHLQALRCYLTALAGGHGLIICGGGCHPLPRARHCESATPEPMFGLSIRLGCPDGVLAEYLCSVWRRYLPQLVALSAASPFHAGHETDFVSIRAQAIEAETGHRPGIQLERCGKGIEIRVCDTPLSLDTAVDLAAYVQSLTRYLLAEVPAAADEVSSFDHHQAMLQAARFGLDGLLTVHDDGTTLGSDILQTLALLRQYAQPPENGRALDQIEQRVLTCGNDAETMRQHLHRDKNMPAVVARLALTWASGRQDQAIG